MSDLPGESRIHLEGLKQADVALLKDVAELTAEQTVNKTLKGLGINPDEPFAAQADMMFLRGLRVTLQGAGFKALITLVAVAVAAAVAWMVVGFKASLK